MLKKTLLKSKSKILTMVLSAMLVSSTLTAYADTDLIGISGYLMERKELQRKG